MFYKNLILSFRGKETNETYRLVLSILNDTIVVCIAATTRAGGLALGLLPATLVIIDISDITHSFNHEQSSFILQLINGKSEKFPKITQIF